MPIAPFSDTEATKALFAKYKPTHVIHLAALGAFSAIPSNVKSIDSCFLSSRRLIHAFEVQGVDVARQHPYQRQRVAYVIPDWRAEGHFVPLDVCVPRPYRAATARGQDPSWPAAS